MTDGFIEEALAAGGAEGDQGWGSRLTLATLISNSTLIVNII
jgi:hypothetical protein